MMQVVPYNAPFFTTWFCTNWTVLFFPLYFICHLISTKCESPGNILLESVRNFRDKGFTPGKFYESRICILSVIGNYIL
jgi:solute carrier family 35 protein F3/4